MANETILKRKEEEVAALKEKIQASAAVIAFDYQGLTVKAFETLRKNVRASGCEVAVIKNNISSRAIEAAGYADFATELAGPKALIFSKEDVIAPAKGVFEFAKANKTVKIYSGIVQGKVVPAGKIEELATLPNYETLLTMLAAGMLGTISQLAIGLNMIAENMEANA